MATIVEDFESATAVVPRTGNWTRDQTQRFSGTWSLKSATVQTTGGTSDCSMTVPAGATTVTFRVRVSTEEEYDPFIFTVAGTEVYRASGVINAWVQPGTYAVSGGQTIRFRYERDITAGGGSNAVWIDDVTFNVPDTTPPGTPPNLRVTAQGVDSVLVAWDPASDNVAVTGYGVWLDGVKQGVDQPGLTYDFASLTPAAHLIEVDAVDGDGNRSAVRAQLTVHLDSEPPSTPPNLRVTAMSPTQVSVAWDAASDNVAVTGYGVYLDSVQQGVDALVLAATFDDLTAGVPYLVEVDAVDAAGNRSAVRASLEVTPEADETPPSTPPNLRVTTGGPYGFAVEWDPASDNISVAGYGIWLDSVKQGEDQVELTASFDGLTAETAYQVAVDAVDSSGNRSSLAQLTHTTPADMPPGTPPDLEVSAVSYTSWTVEWGPAVDDVAVVGYDVAVDGVLVVEAQNVLTLTREGLPDDTDYLVRVWAVDQLGQRSLLPAELIVRTLNDEDPTAPDLVVTAGEDSITVAWSEATDDFGVVGYEVLLDGEVVHSTPGVDYTVDGPVTRRVTIPGLVAGVGYEVRVAAVDTIGQRSADNTVQVETPALPFLPVSTPVYRLGAWAANVRDVHGVTWVVEQAEGWSSSAPVSPVSAGQGGMDGGWSGAGRHGPRRIRLSGVAVASSRAGMLAAKQRLLRVLHPREQGVLRVADARMTRQARVRLDGQIRITDEGGWAFAWELELKAADPRRYATSPVSGVAVIGSLPGEAEVTISLAGTYPTIPARLRLYGPIKDFQVTHKESGTVMRSMPGLEVPGDHRYSYTIDLASRQVLGHVPVEVWPEPRPGRRSLAHLPAWFQLIPGPNTIVLAGDPVPGQSGLPRLVVEAFDAWM